MTERKVFCEECRDDVNYEIITKQISGTIKGKCYPYSGRIARCLNCKSEIYVEEINDYNLKALYEQYRKTNDIISLEKILEIPKKYEIGKRNLSLILGWGEQTFSRYCDGDLPSKQYSDILQKIYADPEYYNEILEENKQKLKSEEVYNKSKGAVDKLLSYTGLNKSKINIVIEYLLQECEDITPLALQKVLYYIQGFYYAFNKTYLFEEDCEAWMYGPVYKEIYARYKNNKSNPIKNCKIEFNNTVLKSSEKVIIDSVIKHICCYSGVTLSKFTHSESPWLLARGELFENDHSDAIITKENIGKYFDSVREKYEMINPNDIKKYTQTMFEQI